MSRRDDKLERNLKSADKLKTRKVLLVEDELELAEVITSYLERGGYVCLHSATLAGSQSLLEQVCLVILDRFLPDGDGLEHCRRWRVQGRKIPILMLSAVGGAEERTQGLLAGVDDFLSKPFEPRELLARTKALLRRQQQPAWESPLHIDSASLGLTPTERRLLLSLTEHGGSFISRQRLLDFVWGTDCYLDERTVDSYVRRLRRKLQQATGRGDWIEARAGLGYRLSRGPDQR